MDNILSALYDGKIFPAEQYWPKMEEYKQIQKKHSRNYDDFAETLKNLNPPLDQKFVDIMEEQLEVLPFEFSEMFIGGFCLGVKLMIEVFQHDLCVKKNS